MRRLAVILLAALAATPTASAAVPALVGSGPDGGAVYRVARSPSDPRVLFAAAETVWKSADGGATWSPYGRRMVRLYFRDIAVGPGPVDTVLISGNDHLYRSRAGGDWEQVQIGDEPVYAASIAVSPADRNVIVAPEGSGDSKCSRVWVTVSTDGGGTWRRVTDAGPRCGPGQVPAEVGVTMSQTDRRSFWVFEESSTPHLWHTANGGATWAEEVLPPGATRVEAPAPGTELVALGSSGPYHRAIAGGPWLPGLGACASVLPEVFLLANAVQITSPVEPVGCAGSTGPQAWDLAPAVGASPLLAATPTGIYRRSSTAWEPSMSGLRAQRPIGAIRLADRSVVIATDNGIYRQDPAGSWAPWAEGLPTVTGGLILATDVSSDGDGRALVSLGGSLWRRGLGEPAWVAVTGSGSVQTIADVPTSQHPIWVTTDRGIELSNDRGATWHVAGPPGFGSTVFDPPRTQPDMAYASFVGSNQLWVTHDRGATWAIVPRARETVVSLRGIVIDPRDANHLVAWGMVPDLSTGTPDMPFRELSTRHAEVVVSHDGGRTFTRPAGATIGEGRYPDAATFAFDAEAAGVLYAGTWWDGVWATADDGVTWGPLGGTDADQAVLAFLPDAPIPAASALVSGRAAAPWRLYATVGRVRSGLARIDQHPRKPRIIGGPRLTAKRTERVASCSGGRTDAGVRSVVRWYAGGQPIGRGRRLRLPVSAVGLPVVCEFRAVSAFADVARRSKAIRPVGRPYQVARPRIAGTVKVGSTLRCTVRWRGRAKSTSYTWRIGRAFRASGSKVTLTARDRGKRLACTAAARNAYGASHVSTSTRKVR